MDQLGAFLQKVAEPVEENLLNQDMEKWKPFNNLTSKFWKYKARDIGHYYGVVTLLPFQKTLNYGSCQKHVTGENQQ